MITKKKAQIQMMETISVLLIFFILVFIGLIFFSKMMKSNVADKMSEFKDLSMIQVAQLASSLPELQCSEENIVKSNCVDLLKLKYCGDILSSAQYSSAYYSYFGYSNITIKQIFPSSTEEYTIYYKKPAATWKSKSVNLFPISIYSPRDENYYFGIMTIEVFSP